MVAQAALASGDAWTAVNAAQAALTTEPYDEPARAESLVTRAGRYGDTLRAAAQALTERRTRSA